MKDALFSTIVSLVYLGILAFVRYFSGFEWAVLVALSMAMTELLKIKNAEPVKINVVHMGDHNKEEANGPRSE